MLINPGRLLGAIIVSSGFIAPPAASTIILRDGGSLQTRASDDVVTR